MMTLSMDRPCQLSLEKIRQLDALDNPIFRGVIRGIQMNTLCLKDSKRQLRLVASSIDWATFDELRTYAWVQYYIASFAMGQNVRDRVEVAQIIGVAPAEFCRYVEERVVEFSDELSQEDGHLETNHIHRMHGHLIQDDELDDGSVSCGLIPTPTVLKRLFGEKPLNLADLLEPTPAWKKPLFER